MEKVADAGLVGAHLGPLVADEADALLRSEAGFHLPNQSLVLRGRISAAIVALAASIGEEERTLRHGEARCIRRQKGTRSCRFGFEADGQSPLLGGIGLDAGAQIDAMLSDS